MFKNRSNSFFRELEQAKSALCRLQQMVETIEPDERSMRNESDLNTKLHISTGLASQSSPSTKSKTRTTSLLSSILSPQKAEPSQTMTTTSSGYADAKMAAQHREIERLVESRQRLHTIKDQIASLHQSMTTPTIPTKKTPEKTLSYREQYLESRNRPAQVGQDEDEGEGGEEEEEESDFGRFECESGDGEEIDDDAGLLISFRNFFFFIDRNLFV